MATKPDLQELGSTGLRRAGGYVYEEFLTNLRGLRGARVYREMADNDPTVGGMLFAVEKIITRLDWRVDPFQDDSADGKVTTQDKEVAVFIESCLHDMSESWEQTLAGFLSFLVYGYSYHEILYKYRGGTDTKDVTRKSQFSDGKIGWRKIPIRSQETLLRWEYDKDTNELVAMVQIDPSSGGVHTIPLEKALHFRTTAHKDNPEGRSILRNVYRPWFFKHRIEEIEAIGIERDLAGLPIAFVPPEMLSSDASDADKVVLAQIQQMVTNVKRNEQEGMVFPAQYDDNGHLMYDFKLLTSGGSRQFNTNEIVQRYDQRMTMALLSDFLLLGNSRSGSHALGITKMELWTMAIDSIAKNIASVINHEAIPRLIKLNGMDTERLPVLAFGEVNNVDLNEVSDFVSKLVLAGVIIPDPKLEDFMRDLAGLPASNHDGASYGMPPVPGGKNQVVENPAVQANPASRESGAPATVQAPTAVNPTANKPSKKPVNPTIKV